MAKLTDFKDNEQTMNSRKKQLKVSEDKYYEKERKRGRNIRDMDCQVSLKKREIGRKLQDVNCSLRKINTEQKVLADTSQYIDDKEIIEQQDLNVQEHREKQMSHIAQRQAKINRWEPKLNALAEDNERKLAQMEHQLLYEDLSKAGSTECALYHTMRSLESDTRKQEQICTQVRDKFQKTSVKTRKIAQNALRSIDEGENDEQRKVKIEEAKLKELIVKRDNSLTAYRHHQTQFKDKLQLFNTLSVEQQRIKGVIKE